jgi:hypothetical protein
MGIVSEGRWLLLGPIAAALFGGAASVLMLNASFPNWQFGFLVFPMLASSIALAVLARGQGRLATLPAAAAAGYCTTAITSWLWHAQVFTCSPQFTAFLMRRNPRLRPPLSCSWSPTSLGAVTLPTLLAVSVVVLIFAIHRARDWLPWGLLVSVFSVFAFRAYLASRLNPSPAAEPPDWVSLMLLFTCVLAIAVIGAWRTGRATGRQST